MRIIHSRCNAQGMLFFKNIQRQKYQVSLVFMNAIFTIKLLSACPEYGLYCFYETKKFDQIVYSSLLALHLRENFDSDRLRQMCKMNVCNLLISLENYLLYILCQSCIERSYNQLGFKQFPSDMKDHILYRNIAGQYRFLVLP